MSLICRESRRLHRYLMCTFAISQIPIFHSTRHPSNIHLAIITQTDDVGVFGSPLSNEYRLVAKHFGLSETDIRTLTRKGIDVIFGSEEEKERLRRIMD